MKTRWIAWAASLVAAAAVAADNDKNLLVNGSFDDPDDSLKGWRYKYDLSGETQWYGQNHLSVSVAPSADGRKSVLKLHGTYATLQAPGQGVKVDSDPVPFKFGEEYELSLWLKTGGPECIIRVMGYTWKPGVKPHDNPTFGELREAYRSKPLRVEAKDYVFAGVPRTWKQGKSSFPIKNASDLSIQHLKPVKFLSVHICAISGSEGDLFVDDVALKRTREAPTAVP